MKPGDVVDGMDCGGDEAGNVGDSDQDEQDEDDDEEGKGTLRICSQTHCLQWLPRRSSRTTRSHGSTENAAAGSQLGPLDIVFAIGRLKTLRVDH